MNYYMITFRLNSDNRFSRRRWENFASDRQSAIDSLVEYCRQTFFDGDLFPPGITILNLDEYLSIFK